MIRQDGISIAFTVTAVFLSLYWSTGEKNFIGIFPAILLISSFGLNYYTGQRYPVVGGDHGNTVFYTLIAVGGMYFAGLLTKNFLTPEAAIPLVGVDALQFGVLMAVAEEQFFRGGLMHFLIPRFGDVGAVVGSAAVFCVYHFFVYAGDTAALMYVFAGGLLLAYVTIRSSSITPSILAHVINNVVAVMWS